MDNNIYNKTDKQSYLVFLVLLFLFPILPQYVYVVGGINTVNFVVFVFLMLYFVLKGRLRLYNVLKELPLFWVFMGFMLILYLCQVGVVKAISFLLSFIIIPYVIITEIDNKQKFVKVIEVLIYGGAVLGIIGLIEEILGYNFVQLFASQDATFFHDITDRILTLQITSQIKIYTPL